MDGNTGLTRRGKEDASSGQPQTPQVQEDTHHEFTPRIESPSREERNKTKRTFGRTPDGTGECYIQHC